MQTEDESKPRRGRGIYLLPNLFTIGAMFAGFYAMIAGMRAHYANAAIAILIAMLLDGLDGRIARMTQTQSEFGGQLDSLSDMLCFGIAPAIVLYTWSLSALGKFGWLAAFLYAVCTALRLARFNTQLSQPNKRYFQGLSTTAASGVVASLVWVCHQYGLEGASLAIPMACITILIGLLKVSTIRYRSFKDLDLRHHVPFTVILVLVLLLVFISFDPPDILLAILSLYALSGPVESLFALRKRIKIKRLRKERTSRHDS